MFTPKYPLSRMVWKKAKPIYEQPSRHYYDVQLINEGFSVLDSLKIKPTLSQEIAWMAHRVVNDPTRNDNEIKSSEWLHHSFKTIKLDIGEAIAVKEARLIVESFTDYNPKVESAKPILDVSLKRLSVDWAAFEEFAHRLKAESSHLNEEEWANRSKNFSKILLDREFIFNLPESRRRWEKRTRDNLNRNIEHHPFVQKRLSFGM